MGKSKKKKPLQKLAKTETVKTESNKTESGKQFSASASNVSHPILPESQPDFPSLQSSVQQTGEATPREAVKKKISVKKISADFQSVESLVPPTKGATPLESVDEKSSGVETLASAARKNEQQKTGNQSGTKPKTVTYSGSELTGEKVDKFHINQVPSSQKKVGTLDKIPLRVNHFPMKINVPGGEIYHYHVEFKFSEKEREVKNRDLLLKTINLFKNKYSNIFVNPHAAVFDGKRNVYTCEELKFSSREFEGEIEIKEHGDSSQGCKIKVKLKCTSPPVDVKDAIAEYFRCGTTKTKPQDAIQALNIVLSMIPKLHCETVGRSHFSSNPMDGTAIDIGGGASLWVGTFKSVRLGWKPMLNVDVANTIGLDEVSVVKFIEKVLESKNPSHISLNNKRHFNMVNVKIKDLKICYNIPGPNGNKRNYRVNQMMPAANKLKVKLDSGEECTIEKYFKDKYNHQLDFPNYPCIHVGKPEKTVYLPIELCIMRKQVLPRFKHIDDSQRQKMIKTAAKMLPKERRTVIEQNLKNLSNHYDKDPYANTFGLKVSGEMTKVDGHILDPPSLKYNNAENNEIEFKKVYNGNWSRDTGCDKDALILKPKELKYWGVLDLADVKDEVRKQFFHRLFGESNSRGIHVDHPIYRKENAENMLQVKKTFEKLHDDIKKTNGSAQLIMVIIARKGPLRGELKYLGDTVFKIPTQFVMESNVVGKGKARNNQVLHNICLKINHKLGGVNHALWKRPPIMNQPVMVMGADVTHPTPHDKCKRPSTAAVVGSTDPNVSQFNVEIRLQEPVAEERVVEEIVQMDKITYSLLRKFRQITRKKPKQIIYYRDGVGERQFASVLKHELSAIRKACKELEPGYEPKVTFVIVQKRHKTRVFVENQKDGIGETNNVPTGTVVDTEITTLSEIDFFLASHEGIQGTTKPTHYHVLWNDFNLSADEIQVLTYYLCHIYSRCERSVSYPAPTYYAHLAAFRAREHHNALIAKTENKNANQVRKKDIENMENNTLMNYFA